MGVVVVVVVVAAAAAVEAAVVAVAVVAVVVGQRTDLTFFLPLKNRDGHAPAKKHSSQYWIKLKLIRKPIRIKLTLVGNPIQNQYIFN